MTPQQLEAARRRVETVRGPQLRDEVPDSWEGTAADWLRLKIETFSRRMKAFRGEGF